MTPSAQDERAGLPSFADAGRLPVALRMVIPPEFQDANRHMNVSHYFDLQTKAVRWLLGQLGFGAEYRELHGHTVFTVEHRLRYLAEVKVGDEVSAHPLLLARTNKLLRGTSLLLNHTSGSISNRLDFHILHVDFATRRSSVLTPELACAADEHIARSREFGFQER